MFTIPFSRKKQRPTMNFWTEIEEFLAEKGFSSEILNSLRKFIDSPDLPLELPRVLENLILLLTHLDQIVTHYPEHLSETYNREWIAVSRKILSYPDWESITACYCKKGKKPLTGCYEKHQVYVTVWTRPPYKTYWDWYFVLLAHVCLAASTLRKWMAEQQRNESLSTKDRDNYTSRISDALLSCRSLAENKNLPILDTLPDLDIPPMQLLEFLQKGNKLFKEIAPLFRYLLKIRKAVHRDKIEVHNNRQPRCLSSYLKIPAQSVDMGQNLDPEQENLVPSIEVLQLPSVDAEDSDEIESDGCTPNEYMSGIEIVSPRITEKKILSPQQKADYGQQIKNHLSMRNQRLPERWETLTLYEISTYLSAVINLIRKGNRSPYLPTGADFLELASLLTTIFWCGQRLDRVNILRCFKDRVPQHNSYPGYVVLSDRTGYWWACPAVPQRKIFPDKSQQSKTLEIVNAFPLVSGIGIEYILSVYIKQSHRHKSQYLFPRPLEIYEKMVSSFLSEVNKRHKTRLTANRIADYLFDQISRKEGSDLVTAMYITGRHHFLGTNLSSYTAIPVSRLQTFYGEVCKDIRKRHFRESPEENRNGLSDRCDLPDCNLHVGSPFVPKRETVDALVIHLKSKLKTASSEKQATLLKLARLHNNMTRYTAFLIAFFTGFRAVKDPFLSAAEIDWESGFAVLSDKDNEDRYNSRIIWIPPVCLEQLKLFREHTHNVMYRFSMLIPEFYSQLASARRQGPGRYMFFSSYNENSSSYDTVRFGPKRRGRDLHEIYDLPFNASRHYLRSNLLERGCPEEVINGFMGHWERGEEAWGTYSGLSPHAFRKALIKHLLPIISEEWEAIAGLGSKL
jgi:hypothetical protein